MRVVRLEGTDAGKRAYTHMYTAMTRGGEARGIEQIRRVGKVLDKMEDIGVKENRIAPDDSGQNVAAWIWRLKDEGGELWLEDAEHAELVTRMGAVNWLPAAVRDVEKTYDLLEKAPTEDPKKKVAEAVAEATAQAADAEAAKAPIALA